MARLAAGALTEMPYDATVATLRNFVCEGEFFVLLRYIYSQEIVMMGNIFRTSVLLFTHRFAV